MSVLEIEEKYCNAIKRQFFHMRSAYRDMLGEKLSLRGRDISKAVLIRMRQFMKTQERICEFLDKTYRVQASDFFVETLTFYLKLVFEKRRLELTVRSEDRIRKKRGSPRPDISVWHGDKFIAVVECKTQLGWKRDSWQQDFLKREKAIRKEFRNVKVFFVVLMAENWEGFEKKDRKTGKQYFVLSEKSPSHLSAEDIDNAIINPIEGLIKQIIRCAR